MSKEVIEAIGNGEVKTEHTARITILSTTPFTRRELASIWLTEKEVKMAEKFEQDLVVKNVKVMLHGNALQNLWSIIPDRYKKDGTVRLSTSEKFDFGMVTPKICKKYGYKRIQLEPSRTAAVRMVALTIETDDLSEYANKRKDFCQRLREKHPHVNYVVHCQKSGPCDLPFQNNNLEGVKHE
jgi:hypothetical protein